MSDHALIEALLNTLDREVLPAIEGGDALAWGKANRLADAVLALLPDVDREKTELTMRVGALHGLYVAARASRTDKEARACALYTFVTRAREATDPQRRGRPTSVRPSPHSLVPPPERTLPAWVPPSGVLGGFRLVRPMASGGLGSLFLARRIEDDGDPLAREVVLKVPHDPGALAAHVPEEELLAAFRAEASALAAIPVHPNLARILAFDVSARPKPFLVMELVEGRTLETELDETEGEEHHMTTARALEILDGVLAGLDAMHASGVGHLDIKPDNVVLRRDTGAATLVDFGLSGRTVRKKCGNPTYAAPEVWHDDRQPESAFAADVYSFACLAYELLMNRRLFDGQDLFGVIRQHFAHDGLPPGLAELRARPELTKLAEILSRALRPNPARRTRVRMLRTELSRVAPLLRDLEWPLVTPPPSSRPYGFEDEDTVSVRGADLQAS